MRAAWLLGRLRAPEAVQSLVRLLDGTNDLSVVDAVLSAWGEIGLPDALEVVRLYVDHPALPLSEASRTALNGASEG